MVKYALYDKQQKSTLSRSQLFKIESTAWPVELKNVVRIINWLNLRKNSLPNGCLIWINVDYPPCTLS